LEEIEKDLEYYKNSTISLQNENENLKLNKILLEKELASINHQEVIEKLNSVHTESQKQKNLNTALQQKTKILEKQLTTLKPKFQMELNQFQNL